MNLKLTSICCIQNGGINIVSLDLIDGFTKSYFMNQHWIYANYIYVNKYPFSYHKRDIPNVELFFLKIELTLSTLNYLIKYIC